jgi:hypothetical protein
MAGAWMVFQPQRRSRSHGGLTFRCIALPVSLDSGAMVADGRARGISRRLSADRVLLVFVAAWSLPQVGPSASVDDWLNYQIASARSLCTAGWRAAMPSLDFQPLYQLMTGALTHLGDSSVGGSTGFPCACWWGLCSPGGQGDCRLPLGLAAAVAALATVTLGPPWYFSDADSPKSPRRAGRFWRCSSAPAGTACLLAAAA